VIVNFITVNFLPGITDFSQELSGVVHHTAHLIGITTWDRALKSSGLSLMEMCHNRVQILRK